MERFGIYSPTMGKVETCPNVLLANAFLQDCSDVVIWNGEIRKIKKRLPELMRTLNTIMTANDTTKTFKVAGNLTVEFTSDVSVYVYDSDDNDGTYTVTGNSTVDASGNTLIVVNETVTDSAASGKLFNTLNVVSTDSTNKDFLKIVTPDGNPIIRYQRITTTGKIQRLIAFTKTHVYCYDASLTRWVSIWTVTAAASCDTWDSDQYGDYLVATNNLDAPLYWDANNLVQMSGIDTASGPEVATGVYITRAAFVKSYEGYLLLGNCILSDSSPGEHYMYYSAFGCGVGADVDWEIGGGADAGRRKIEGAGEITGGFGLWQGKLIVFKRNSIREVWMTTGDDPFNDNTISDTVGCVAPGSIINDKEGRLYFFATDKTIREITAGVISQAIDDSVRSINVVENAKVRATYSAEYNALEWAVPLGSATENDTVLFYREGKWVTLSMPVVTFGAYYNQVVLTWDTLPYATWELWSWDSWDYVPSATDFPIDICSDASGCTYRTHGAYTDDSAAYDSYFVLATDLTRSQALGYFKRILQHYAYLYSSSQTLTLSVKKDNALNWLPLGSVSITGSNEIQNLRLPIDARAQTFLFKYSFTGQFRYIGSEFDYLMQGRR